MSEQTIEHLGYEGSIKYSSHDKVYYGKILYVRDCILYHGKTEADCREEFRLAVEDYIRTQRDLSENENF